MKREEIMKAVADWFEVEPNEDGKYDIDDYDWTSGCSMGGSGTPWLCLASVVRCFESIIYEYGLDDEE